MKRWWLLIALLLSVGINVGILATLAFQPRLAGPAAIPATGGPPPADPLPGDPGVGPSDPLPREGRMPPVVERMADELHLESEKREAFVEIQRAFFEQTLAARSGMARIQREIRREVTSEDPDRERADRLLAELSAAHTDLERAFVTNLLDSRELLDGQQERRFMHFLRRMRQVRGDVERRFRERWRGLDERRGPGGPFPRGRRGQERPRPAEPPAAGDQTPSP